MGGSPETLATKGIVGYLQAIQWSKGRNIERLYIAARDKYIHDAEKTAYLAQKQGLGKIVGKPKTYYAPDTRGERREHVLIEMRLGVSPFAPSEQGRLLEE